MAQVQAHSPPVSAKRGPSRSTRAAQPPLKKVKASQTPQQSSPSIQSPSVQSPAPSTGGSKLPTKLADCRPLPTLASPQALSLPASNHQSLAASAVLHASLDRSRLRWVQHGVFGRYWTKPESGKNARPPPPNNPEAKWMKHRGPCRIRVEPHIFECELYVEERPRPPVQKIQQQPPHGQGAYGGYGQQYRQQPHAYGHRPFSPAQQQTPVRQSPAPPPPQQPQQSTPQQQAEKKTGPDPVISMLAGRASSDPELKALMKEVASGAANAEQLKVFQGHIDELTKIINEKKKKEEEEEAAAAEAKKAQDQQQESIQYDGAADQKPHQPPQPSSAYRPQHQPQAWPTPPPRAVQAPTPPPPPSAPSVILQFTTPGATEDRFLFPPNSIVESLSPQHLLCSTFVVRKGCDSADSSTLNASTEYFQPVTFMVEVAYGRESLVELVKRHVEPADQVRKWMEDVMQRCTRAPEAHLALRLPVKGAEGAETEEERAEEEGKMAEEMKKRGGAGATGGHGPSGKYVKKPGPKKGEGGRPVGVKNGEGGGKRPSSAGAGAGAGAKDVGVEGPGPQAASTHRAAAEKETVGKDEKEEESAGASGEASKLGNGAGASESKEVKETEAETQADEGDESARPKRVVRKSVRISDA